jgi:REP element-mobilizing transposase RayT
VFSVTICTTLRPPIFRDLALGAECVQQLFSLQAEHDVTVYAYCLMPDHVHLLLRISAGTSLEDIIGSWKSLCFRTWRARGGRRSFWQRGYYERALRRGDDLRNAALYILDNPVRAGMVTDHRLYPLCGSMEWQLG